MAAAAAAEEPPSISLWEQICAEFEAEQPPHPDHPVQKPPPPPFAPACLPVCTIQVPLDAESALSGEEGESVPSVPVEESPPLEIPLLLVESPTPEVPDLKTCSPREFLEYYIFPVLLPGMAELLHQAKKEKCFEVSLFKCFVPLLFIFK
ncbi:hypothetical protein lerEdw1_002330 [Lerista edwardsae]|nr:hypothetical protein lerEdw1_002330 [Lerista edwardsae]